VFGRFWPNPDFRNTRRELSSRSQIRLRGCAAFADQPISSCRPTTWRLTLNLNDNEAALFSETIVRLQAEPVGVGAQRALLVAGLLHAQLSAARDHTVRALMGWIDTIVLRL